jgi:hypothetical protein
VPDRDSAPVGAAAGRDAAKRTVSGAIGCGPPHATRAAATKNASGREAARRVWVLAIAATVAAGRGAAY